MSSLSQAATPSASVSAAELASQVNDLREELLMQKAILQSLDEVSETPTTQQEKRDCRDMIEQIQAKLKEARHAHHNGS